MHTGLNCNLMSRKRMKVVTKLNDPHNLEQDLYNIIVEIRTLLRKRTNKKLKGLRGNG